MNAVEPFSLAVSLPLSGDYSPGWNKIAHRVLLLVESCFKRLIEASFDVASSGYKYSLREALAPVICCWALRIATATRLYLAADLTGGCCNSATGLRGRVKNPYSLIR
jgi:hypothetical protein